MLASRLARGPMDESLGVGVGRRRRPPHRSPPGGGGPYAGVPGPDAVLYTERQPTAEDVSGFEHSWEQSLLMMYLQTNHDDAFRDGTPFEGTDEELTAYVEDFKDMFFVSEEAKAAIANDFIAFTGPECAASSALFGRTWCSVSAMFCFPFEGPPPQMRSPLCAAPSGWVGPRASCGAH